MNPAFVIFGVRAIIRLGKAGYAAYEQAVIDRDIHVLHSRIEGRDILASGIAVLKMSRHRDRLISGDLKAYWKGSVELGHPVDEAAELKLIEAAQTIWGEWRDGAQPQEPGERVILPGESASIAVLRQWADDAGPPDPWVRIALAMGEVALDFVATSPDIFVDSKGGAKLLAAFAGNLGELLPDPNKPGDWEDSFAQRALSIIFRAGLEAVRDHSDVVADEKHLQELTRSVAEAFRKTVVDNPDDIFTWVGMRDALLGPVSKAAFDVLHENQAAFLGKEFAGEKALGAFTGVFFEQVADEGLVEVFTRDGVIEIYKGMLGVVVDKPELVLGADDEASAALARDLLSGFAGTLRAVDPPYSGATAVQLLHTSLDVFSHHVPSLIEGKSPWDNVARESLQNFLTGLKKGIKPGGDFELGQLFTEEQALQYARIFFDQVGKTPGMVLGDNTNPELINLVASVSSAIADPQRDLLSAEAWLEITAVAAEEAARNPARLFGIGLSNPEAELGVAVIKKLLARSAANLRDGGRTGGQVLFGETLKDAIVVSLKATAADTTVATAKVPDAIDALAARLDKMITEPEPRDGHDVIGFQIGARQWSWLFRNLVADVVATGEMPQYSDAELLDMLRKD